MPPYVPTLESRRRHFGTVRRSQGIVLDNYTWLTEDALYFNAYLSSLCIAGISTILTLLVGYPIAYGMARAPTSWRPILLMLVILPFWTSFLIRVYAWIGILKTEGLLNQLLLALGVIDQPLIILQHQLGGLSSASSIPTCRSWCCRSTRRWRSSTIRCSRPRRTSAARRSRAFWKITFPLSLPGIIAGCLLVFIPAVGEFVIPDLLGGSDTLMIGKTLWNEFFNNRDWPVASAVAVILLLLLVIPIVLFQHVQARAQVRGATMKRHSSRFNVTSIVLGLRLPLSADRPPGHLLLQRLASWSRCGAASRRNGTGRCSRNEALLDAAWVTLARRARSRRPSRPSSARMAALALDPLRPLPRPHAVLRHGLRAAGHARSHHRPVAAAAVRRDAASTAASGPIDPRPHHLLDVLRHGRRAVAARHLRPQPRGSGDGSRRAAAQDLLRRSPCRSSRRPSWRAGCSPSRCRSTIW